MAPVRMVWVPVVCMVQPTAYMMVPTRSAVPMEQTRSAISLQDVLSGVLKSVVFAFVIAWAGCMRGMQCGRSSEAVGAATTSAMVTAIVMIVVCDATITLVYNRIGF